MNDFYFLLDTGKRLINEERVQIYETPKVRRRNDVDLNSVDEYNIVNTILRKHPGKENFKLKFERSLNRMRLYF